MEFLWIKLKNLSIIAANHLFAVHFSRYRAAVQTDRHLRVLSPRFRYHCTPFALRRVVHHNSWRIKQSIRSINTPKTLLNRRSTGWLLVSGLTEALQIQTGGWRSIRGRPPLWWRMTAFVSIPFWPDVAHGDGAVINASPGISYISRETRIHCMRLHNEQGWVANGHALI